MKQLLSYLKKELEHQGKYNFIHISKKSSSFDIAQVTYIPHSSYPHYLRLVLHVSRGSKGELGMLQRNPSNAFQLWLLLDIIYIIA